MDIFTDVITRLTGLGYPATSNDDDDINFAIRDSEERIKAETNLDAVPEGLRYVWIDMAAGTFLRGRASAGQLGPKLGFSGEAKRITEGDVTVEMNTDASAASVFLAAVERMAEPPKSLFAAFRRLTW